MMMMMIASLSCTSLFRRFMDANNSVKIWKTRHKMSVDMRIFFTVLSDTTRFTTNPQRIKATKFARKKPLKYVWSWRATYMYNAH